MAEEANHARFVEPCTQDQNGGIDSDQDENPASEGIDDRPCAAMLLALLITGRVDGQFECLGLNIIRVRAINELDVIIG